MSTQEHTPEPWRLYAKWSTISIECETGPSIVAWPGFDESDRTVFEHIANAARIVACVNAMAGINDPAAYRISADAAIKRNADADKWYADWIAQGQMNTGDFLPVPPQPDQGAKETIPPGSSDQLAEVEAENEQLRAALQQVDPMANTLMGELSGKGPSTNWGIVNKCLCDVAAALAAKTQNRESK